MNNFRHGDLVLVNKKPQVVINIEGVTLFVDVLTFIDEFDSDATFTTADVATAKKQGYDFVVFADREEETGDDTYDNLFNTYGFVTDNIIALNKNIKGDK